MQIQKCSCVNISAGRDFVAFLELLVGFSTQFFSRKNILKTSLVDSNLVNKYLSVYIYICIYIYIYKVKLYSIFIYRFDSCLLFIFVTYCFLSLSYPPSLPLSPFFFQSSLFQTLNSHSEESKGKQSAFIKVSKWNPFCQKDAFTITDSTLIRF